MNSPTQLECGKRFFQNGLVFEAINCFKAHLQIDPNSAEAYSFLGVAFSQVLRFNEAIEAMEKAVEIFPGNANTLYNLSNLLAMNQKFDLALASLNRAIEIKPNDAEFLTNKGVLLCDLLCYVDAVACLDVALSIKTLPLAWTTRGIALKNIGRYDEAIISYKNALNLNPKDEKSFFNLAILYGALDRHEEAVECYQNAIQIKPDYIESYYNLGNEFFALKNFQSAIAVFQKTIQLNPCHGKAISNLGNALKEQGQFEDALHYYDLALNYLPNEAAIWSNRGTALEDLKRNKDALDSYAKALLLNPDQPELLGVWLHMKMQFCDWSHLDEQIDRLVEKVQSGKNVTPPFAILGLNDDEELHYKATQIWANERYPKAIDFVSAQSEPKDKIHIGYFSGDYHKHAMMFLMKGIFKSHDRSRFYVTAFSFGPDPQDEFRIDIQNSFDEFIDSRTLRDEQVVQLARDQGVDIAVDLSGYTQNSRTGIFSRRVAPIQVNYLGYPGTMGVDYIDYILADPLVIPQASKQFYSEKVAYLPNSYQSNDRNRIVPTKGFGREELGLPAEGFVFCCFNNSFKILPKTFDIWMRILHQVDGSVLWLLEDNPFATANLKVEAQKRGITVDRLVFAKRISLYDHLARHQQADLFLDTFPYNAHTSASDALWMGVPVLTVGGHSFASRVSTSLIHAIEVPELICQNFEEYTSKAIEFGNHPEKISVVTQKIIANRTKASLFDTALMTRRIEKAYQSMMDRHVSGLLPDTFRIPS